MAMLRHYFKTCTGFWAGSAFLIASALVISCFWLLNCFWLPGHPSVCVSYLIGLLRNYWTSAINMKYFPNFWGMHDWDTWIIIRASNPQVIPCRQILQKDKTPNWLHWPRYVGAAVLDGRAKMSLKGRGPGQHREFQCTERTQSRSKSHQKSLWSQGWELPTLA